MPLSNEDLARLKAVRPNLWIKPRLNCKTCLDTRVYRWYTDSSRTEVADYECDCRQQWLMHLWMLNAGIGLSYQRMTWEDIQTVPPHVVEQVMNYAVNAARNVAAGRNLVLWSKGAGTGKTLLLILLSKALMTRGMNIYASQFNDIITQFTKSWRDAAELNYWERRIRNVDGLNIDDWGKEHKGRIDMVEAMVDQLIRARVSDALPTIITTNLSPDEIRQGYGGYVMSLLSEAADFIEVTGSDFRPRRQELARKEIDLGLSRPITAV